jgi:proteic killer suppression protein
MEIFFDDEELADSRKWRGRFPTISKKLQQRFDEIKAADNLAFLERNYPGWRCHEYSGKGKGTYTIDLSGAWRLWFRPTQEPPPRKPDGGIDKTNVTSITIIGVINPH